MKFLISFLILVSASFAWAELSMKIEIDQKDFLQFKIQLRNLTGVSQTWTLSPYAQIMRSSPELKILKSKPSQISLESGKSAEFEYQIKLDTSKSFFTAGENSLLPENQNEKTQTRFELKSKLLPGFEIIHSATGFDQNGIAVVFGKFTKYISKESKLRVYLSKPDAALAQTLLDKLSIYLQKFESEYGPYPYQSFAVVESPDEIGYAFPQMTWMGSQLLRFPFILTTSLPHELLHSWWGNGVFVRYEEGNWCEGLTTFGSDYALLDEGGKKRYRLKALSQYASYVKEGNDIPLSKFISRGEDRSLQAIGYDKVMIVFVMLEQQLGEKTFKKALQNFYKKFQYKQASYKDIFQVMEETSGQDLSQFESYWIHSTGFLNKDFLTAESVKSDKGSALKWTAKTSEIQKIPNQSIQIQINPVEKSENRIATVRVDKSGKSLMDKIFLLPPKMEARSYWVDPEFRLFRELHEMEMPLTFSKLFGQPDWSVKFSDDSWLSALKTASPSTKLQNVSEFDFSKPHHYVVSLDQAQSHPEIQAALTRKKIKIQDSSLILENSTVDLNQNSVFLSLRVQKAYVTVIQVNDKLPYVRWFQRWLRYGHQSYVALTPTAALVQGSWIDLFENELK